MMRKALILTLLLLPACRDEAEVAAPEPMTMTAEAVGYFCQMTVLDHAGPKAQIFLKDVLDPLFFGQVSDAVAFRRMPEQAGEIVAVYVSDMGAASDWARPGPDNWIAAEDAVFVTGSTRMGGMNMPEAVPFATREKADDFAAEYGGQIVSLSEIPELGKPPSGSMAMPESDYANRLRALAGQQEEQP